jgi:hypothetical protein
MTGIAQYASAMPKFAATISAIISGDEERQMPCGNRLSINLSYEWGRKR